MSATKSIFRSLILAISLSVLLFGSCTQFKYHFINRGKTCLVLSVGGPKGFAHAGAIDALEAKGIDIDCVYGNSMGAVIGGLYAYAPKEDISKQIEDTFTKYISQSKEDAKSNAITGFIVGAGIAVFSGGTLGWETMLGSAGIGALSTEKFDNKRFEKVLNRQFNSAKIETLPLEYATSYFKKTSTGVVFTTASSGNLAKAIARSANNPFIFKKTNLSHIDPGLDRAASVPVDDAIKHFEPKVVIAINVTSDPAVYTETRGCKVIEIIIKVPEVENLGTEHLHALYNQYYQAGYDAVFNAL
mgnify:FL=1